jgi:divalent metal cation (Fe/Co/Zn/Cd) transporter
MGPNYILLNLSVNFKDSLDVSNIEENISTLSSQIKKEYPLVQRVFVEAEENNL